MHRFSTGELPEGDWLEFRKKVTTRMVRIDGPFEVQISGQGPESVVRCDDGWLAVDARGYPYPLAADEQPVIYEPA
jgi:hypothetical protein